MQGVEKHFPLLDAAANLITKSKQIRFEVPRVTLLKFLS